MSGHIVYDGVPRTHNDDDDNQPRATLFAGQRLWFSHVIPQRRQMIQNARMNGAVIVDRDTDADVRLVDHLRKNNAPGTYSYRYVELSLRNGQLENLADHAVGAPSRVSRPVGSAVTGPKAGRTPFTPEDDKFLWDWIKPFIDRGGAWKGNEIYKQMEEANPRHTFQSWRDRWIKHTQFQKRQVSATAAAREPSVDEPAAPPSHSSQKKRRRELHDDGEEERVRPEVETSRSTTVAAGRVVDKLPEVAAADHEASHTASTVPERSYQVDGVHENGKKAQSSKSLLPARPKSFTKEEYDELYELVATLAGDEFDDFDTPWEVFAEERGTHSAAEWKQFFMSRVIPDYCKKNSLTLSEAAPYLYGKADEQAVNTCEPLNPLEHDQATPATSETEEEYRCTNCFTVEAVKWRHDIEGKLICYECAKFVRRHGYHRPSTWSIGESAANTDGNGQSRTSSRRLPSSDAQNDSIPQAILPQDSSLADGRKQNLLLATEDNASPPAPPSIQPESSSTSRPPVPNESRKRLAGRGTQSQSTQELSQSGTQSQTLHYSLQGESSSQTIPSQDLAAEIGETQSTESDSQVQQSSLAERDSSIKATAALALSPKWKGKQPQRGPGDTSVQQRPSSGTTNTVHGSSRLHSRTDSKRDDELLHSTTPYDPSKRVRTDRNYSPLFVPQHDDNDEEHEQKEDLELARETDSSSSVPSIHHQASDQFETAQESVQEYETGPEEQPLTYKRAFKKLSKILQDVNAEFDMALNDLGIPDRPDVGRVGVSVMPHDEISNEDVPMLKGISQFVHTQNSPKVQTDVESHSFLEPPATLFRSSRGSGDLSKPSENAKGKEKEDEEQRIEQEETEESSSPKPDGHETDEWIALQRSLHPHVPNLEPMLFKAIESTSFNFGLASEVVDIMLASRRRVLEKQRRQSRMSGGVGVGTSSAVLAEEADLDMESLLPQAMRGVWTETDDSLLLSPDANDVNKVLGKHGRDACDARFVFLREFVEE
ncbi:uncharacterized protein Z520_08401 [Fonsecaea multimorphosa CBS 102226]|uniref:DNA-binding protein RAP1 n=1 Tax=Fonsecaea multimorphosa CBS 102226 TaxID=1442371 RepID=A0A0D2JYN3_9EURO|nr:uncharacterized protein Z520_08401 [Fonsecaea multimorphosa CBS 102226]KIX95694.1 hypothetical protein Z520_08401 [Fonsecaea multimorphosa CBS 102226]OAL21650.1 hypothetical protein AYO22_07827 [Fonsecaea multimorphosa]